MRSGDDGRGAQRDLGQRLDGRRHLGSGDGNTVVGQLHRHRRHRHRRPGQRRPWRVDQRRGRQHDRGHRCGRAGNVISGNDWRRRGHRRSGADGQRRQGQLHRCRRHRAGGAAQHRTGVIINDGAHEHHRRRPRRPRTTQPDLRQRFHGVTIYGSGANGNTVRATSSASTPRGWRPPQRRQRRHRRDDASGNTIGGTTPGEGNLIAFNGDNGVCVQRTPPRATASAATPSTRTRSWGSTSRRAARPAPPEPSPPTTRATATPAPTT